MVRNYSGNLKPFASILVSDTDLPGFLPVLEELSGLGKKLCIGKKAKKKSILRRSSVVLAFLSEESSQDKSIQNAILYAHAKDIPVVPILKNGDTQLPGLLQPFLGASNAIFADRYEAKELAARLNESEYLKMEKPTKAQKAAFRNGMIALILAALLIIGGAAFVLFGNGIARVRDLIYPPTPTPEPTPVPTFTPVPEPTSSLTNAQQTALEKWGMTEEDLLKIHDLVLIGGVKIARADRAVTNEYSFNPDAAVREEWNDEDGSDHYFWLDGDYGTPGEEVQMDENVDLSILPLMKNLYSLTLVSENITEIPDLTGFNKLREVNIYNCPLISLAFISDCHYLTTINLKQTKVADLSPLTACQKLNRLFFRDNADDPLLQSLEGFAPRGLLHLELYGCTALKDCSPLSACSLLQSLNIDIGDSLTDFSFLGELKKLEELRIFDYGGRRNMDLSSMENIGLLKKVELDSRGIRDVSFLAKQSKLSELRLNNCEDLDLSCLRNCITLKHLFLDLDDLRDCSFLGSQSGLDLCISTRRISDFSGLENVRAYFNLDLNIWDGFSADDLIPYIQECTTSQLGLCNVRNLDLAKLPNTISLRLCNADIKDLNGLGSIPRLTTIDLDYCRKLKTLDGLQDCKSVHSVRISGCDALENVDALYSRTLSSLEWSRMAELLPDLSRIGYNHFISIRIDSVPLLENLDFLNSMTSDIRFGDLVLNRLDNVQDLEPALNRTGTRLVYPSQLEEQLERVRTDKYPDFKQIERGDDIGERLDVNIQLHSIEDLDTMSDLKLSYVKDFRLYGGTVLQEDEESDDHWERNKVIPYVRNRDTDEERPAGEGTLDDFSKILKLKNLEQLDLSFQPLSSIEGIQELENLSGVTLQRNPNLEDVSPLFLLNGIEHLNIGGTKVSDISGIQNLRRLRGLHIYDTNITDLSVLKDVDYSYSSEEGGFDLNIDGLSIEDYSFLEAVPKWGWLSISMGDRKLAKKNMNWIDYVKNSEIRELEARNETFQTTEQLAAFLEAHPELECINLSWNNRLNDISPLLSHPGLKRVRVTKDMKKAIKSLGDSQPFELKIEG